MKKPSSKPVKTLIAACVALMATTFTAPSYALFASLGNFATERTQIASWVLQYRQMYEQYQKLKQQYDSLNGIRGMADLVNNPALRHYLPDDYKQILDAGYGNWLEIREAAKIIDISQTSIDPNSESGKLFLKKVNQLAINKATYEAAFKRASERFSEIQVLLDKVNDAPDAKDMADLQGRIQSEQVMMANEQAKLAMLTSLAKAQEDIYAQQGKEITLKSITVGMPKGW